MKDYKTTELSARMGIKEELERNREICRQREELYNKQNDLKGSIYKIERELSR